MRSVESIYLTALSVSTHHLSDRLHIRSFVQQHQNYLQMTIPGSKMKRRGSDLIRSKRTLITSIRIQISVTVNINPPKSNKTKNLDTHKVKKTKKYIRYHFKAFINNYKQISNNHKQNGITSIIP